MKKLSLLFILLLVVSCGQNSVENSKNIEVSENNSSTQVVVDDVEENIVEENDDEENDDEENDDDLVMCEEKYNALFEKYGKNYSDCYFNKPDVSSCEAGNTDKGKINLVVIFDASGSMGAYIGNETMMEIAKDKISDYISDLDSNTNLSFLEYGHKGAGTNAGKNASCVGVENIYKFGEDDLVGLKSKISSFKPNGWTPIANSLDKAKELIKNQTKENDKNIVLLVSDGKETCGGSPVNKALELSKMKNTFVDVIGFNVAGDTQKQLMDIAKNGKGNYYDVKSRLDFEDTFNKTKNFLKTMSCGASKAAIELNYGAEAINKYYSCVYSLKEEQVFMMVDAPEECKDYFDERLETRFEENEESFRPMLKQGEKILDNFTNIIEEIEDKLEVDDDVNDPDNDEDMDDMDMDFDFDEDMDDDDF